MTTDQNTPDQNKTNMDREYLTHGRSLALALERWTENIEKYINDNQIDNLWAKAHKDAAKAAGYRDTRTFYDAPWAQHRVDYTMNLANEVSEDICFSGSDREGDYHSYYIDPDFLFPATRQKALDRLRDDYTAKAAAQADAEAAAAEKKRAAAEAEYNRLRQVLGKAD